MIASQKAYYPALTGLRALAAYMVFFYHANPFQTRGWQRPVYLFTNDLHVGVSLFFVLSGFLIYTRYAEESETNKSWLIRYLQNRFARIYPLYFVVLVTLMAITVYHQGGLSLNSELLFTYFTNFTLLQGFFDELKFTGIMQAWSLTVEECFYLLIPFILLWKKKYSLFILPVLFALTGLLCVLIFQNIHFYGFFSDIHFMAEYTFFGRCFEFFAGIGLAIFIKRADVTQRHSANYTYLSIIAFLGLIIAVSLFGENGSPGTDRPFGLAIHQLLLPIAEIALFYGLIREKTWLQKILASRLFEITGKSSYAFYLIHAGYFYEVVYYHISKNVVVIFIVMNLIAIALYYVVEKPLHQKWRAIRT